MSYKREINSYFDQMGLAKLEIRTWEIYLFKMILPESEN